MSADERYKQRLVKVKPLLDAFFSWLEEQTVSGKGKLIKAVRYALNEKKCLYTFLEDGNVPIDNNRAENAIRPFAVGRKNWWHPKIFCVKIKSFNQTKACKASVL